MSYTEQLSQALAIPGTPTRPVAKTASFNGSSVDLQQGYKRLLAYIDVGAVSGTTPTLDAKWQESTDDVTYTDVSGTGVSITQLTAANKTVTMEIRVDQLTKRYVRVAFTIGGTTPSFTMSHVLFADAASHKPAKANDAAAVNERIVAS